MTPHAQTTLIVLVVLDMVISLATTLVRVLLVTGSKRLRPGSGVGSDGESDLEVGYGNDGGGGMSERGGGVRGFFGRGGRGDRRGAGDGGRGA